MGGPLHNAYIEQLSALELGLNLQKITRKKNWEEDREKIYFCEFQTLI